MFVITVVPLKRGVTIDALSYFSSKEYPIGTILTIPVRSSSALGLVTEIKEVSTAKTALRAATFSLKKLPAQDAPHVLGEAYIKTARELATHYASSVGSVLYNLLPPELRTGDIGIPHTHHFTPQTVHQPHVLVAKKSDRHLAYRSLVRETFAHSGSILLLVPSSVEAEELRAVLEHGIVDRLILLSSACTASEIRKGFAALEDFSKTKLIIATPSYAFIERHDITHVIVEHARSPHYRELVRPYLDYRTVITTHARHTGRKVLFGDILVRTEEEALRRNDTYLTYGESPKRIELPGVLSTVQMNDTTNDTTKFALLSPDVVTAIKDVRKRKGHVFIFAARRGLSPVVACMDCGHIFRSKESGCPYSLIRTIENGVEMRWFVCSTSGERIRAADTCDACGSWRLRERGIGIQQVYDELHKIVPTIPITLFDHITAKTYKKARFLRDSFFSARGNILLGTHMAIPHLIKPVDLSIIVSMDALSATPTWRLEEENLALLLRLREVTSGTVFVQTRAQETPTLEYARHGSVEHFYTDELALRKNFLYPPFSTFIHLTWQGPTAVVHELQKTIETTFAEYTPSIYQNPASLPDSPIMYCLMRLPQGIWPDTKLAALLRTLPPSVRIMVNPDRIV